MWFFVIWACTAEACIAPRSLPIYETRRECVEAAGLFIAEHLPNYTVRMTECVREHKA